MKDGVDDGHVLDGVLEGDGDFSVFQNCFGESIALGGNPPADRGFSPGFCPIASGKGPGGTILAGGMIRA